MNTIKYGETSLIAKIYTEQFGLQSYIINGVRTARSKNKASNLQPLCLLDLVVYHKENKDLQRISELKNDFIFRSIPFDVAKGSISLFIIEMLGRCVVEEDSNPEEFEFIYQSVKYLDQSVESVSNFHLSFMIHLTGYLGFQLQLGSEKNTQYFDLMEGQFCNEQPDHNYSLDGRLPKLLLDLLSCPLSRSHEIVMSGADRRGLLNGLITYYRLHLEQFGKLKSPEVLQEILG
ncbi:MAG: DNA repair protein RecO [Bacteroidetes bacterium]|nr:DNA repair protein RecO [Bacteroidota bacterium]